MYQTVRGTSVLVFCESRIVSVGYKQVKHLLLGSNNETMIQTQIPSFEALDNGVKGCLGKRVNHFNGHSFTLDVNFGVQTQ